MATSRPRGFIEDWSPRPDTLSLVNNVKSILMDNGDIAPLTLRQIFYMLVTGYDYDKTEKAYKRLCETMNKARRAQYISMDDIRDDGLRRKDPRSWSGPSELIETFKSAASNFRLNRQRGQDQHIMVCCEAGGLLPQLASYCEEYGVNVLSSGGFDSVTTKHGFAEEACGYNSVEILHIGDHDTSGVHMHNNLDEDLSAFVEHYGGDILVTRLAVVPEQIRNMSLPTAPAKMTDKRSFVGRTTQAEAIPPRSLKEIVQSAILSRFDLDAYEDVLEREREIREELSAKIENL